MNQDVKERWLSALRSGDYKQTDGYLNITPDDAEDPRKEGFCCLGVLCEIAVADGVVQKQRVSQEQFFEYGDPEAEDWDYSVLPLSVRDWAGLKETNPMVSTNREYPDDLSPISDPNDSGWSFEKIADLIEEQL